MDPHPTSPGTGQHTGDDDTYPAALAAFVERFAADLTEAGMPRMPSRVFACLLVSSEGALSSAELARRLRISPAAVSGAVRYLAQVSMVSREREPGSRRERYRLLQDIWYEAIASRDADLLRWVSTLRDGARTAGETGPAGQRLNETAEFMEFLVEEMRGVLERWRARRASHGSA
ncbi:MarR family transcriptional regulator [Streptomyces avicenniae]|uniref:GbsR/MarR family transcriptional regulator n=1 Tax=Streptomyces avicenniae TaxID=500153 RepID=UPI00069AB304